MKLSSVAFVCALIAFVPVANAAEARLTDCVTMQKEVAQALENAQPGTDTEKARVEANAGRSFCAANLYAKGVAAYSRALQLLGKA